MKKFLSLVLALVMTMSLVTISAGATEYKDLTDKDEIQYEEAVAVLNRIGVITGYDDGSFRPTTELTRGAAAKIIVSLLIGPEAASNLPNTYAPYPDVPAGHTFAGVISYCKTKGIISGYGDGTFKPANTLTGYAFAKMLLGAVGYDANLERFVDTGWTMNVAAVGQAAGLFDRLQFDGGAAVTREQACQLALNALKATVVQYSQGLNVNVTGDNTNVVVSGGQTRSYKTSNQEFARNIRTRQGNSWGGSLINNIATDYYTVEFAEEHFVDLRLEHDKWDPTPDEFGRPSAEWSYKKVTIGTYPLEPDFEFTTQIAHKEATEAARERATGLGKYDLDGTAYSGTGAATRSDTTTLWFNGEKVERGEVSSANGVAGLTKIHEIADLTDNGNLVQVYVSNYDADFITDVVVIQTQLMEVKRVNKEYVSLDLVSPASKDEAAYGYNLKAIHEDVANVRVDDEPFAVLSALKEGDKVAIIPVADDTDGREYSVSRAYVPETVTGELQKATTYSNVGKDRNAVDVTVAGTTYKVANWSKDLVGIDANKIKITRKDVTLLLDEYGNALLGKNVGEDSEYMVIGNWAQTLMNGRIVNLVEGWTVGGEAVSLNVGNATQANTGMVPGDLVKYTSANATGSAEWSLLDGYDGANSAGIYQVDRVANLVDPDTYVNASENKTTAPTNIELKSSNVRVALENFDHGAANEDVAVPYANDVKFIYVDFDSQGDVETIEIIKGRQNVAPEDLNKINTEIRGGRFDWQEAYAADGTYRPGDTGVANSAEAYVKDGFVKAVVIKTESGNPNGQIAYVANYIGQHGTVNEGGLRKAIWGYEVIMPDSDGKLDMLELYTTKDFAVGTFIRYTKTEAPAEVTEDVVKENFYTTSAYNSTEKGTSVALVQGVKRMPSTVTNDLSKSFVQFDYAFKTGNQDVLEDVVDALGKSENALLASINDDDGELVPTYGNSTWGYAAVVSGYRGLGDSRDGYDVRTLSIDADKNNWFDLRDINYRDTISSVEDLSDYVPESISLAIVFNDKADADNFRSVSRVIVLHATPKSDVSAEVSSLTITGAPAADAIVADQNYSITATATGTKSNATYTFVWTLNGTEIGRQSGLGKSSDTITIKGSDLLGKLVCAVYSKEDGKLVSSAVEKSVTYAAAEMPASAEITAPTELTRNTPADFTIEVKNEDGVAITSAAALAALKFNWGQIVYNEETGKSEFKVFQPADLAKLGATVAADGTLTFEDGSKAAGMKIACQVETKETVEGGEPAGSTEPPVNEDGTVNDAAPVVPDEEVVLPGEVKDDPMADNWVVTFAIEEGVKVTVNGKNWTSASANTVVEVPKGDELTFSVAPAAGSAGVIDVDGGDYNLAEDPENTYSFVVTASGTITVSLATRALTVNVNGTKDATLSDDAASSATIILEYPLEAYETGTYQIGSEEAVKLTTGDTTEISIPEGTDPVTVTITTVDHREALVTAMAATTGENLKANPADSGTNENTQSRFSSWTREENVYSTYSVAAAANADGVSVDVTVTMTNLKLHMSGINGLLYPAYWSGFTMPRTFTANEVTWTRCTKSDGTYTEVGEDANWLFSGRCPTYILGAEGPFDAQDPSGPVAVQQTTQYYKGTVGETTVYVPIVIHINRNITTVPLAEHGGSNQSILSNAGEWPEA